MVELEDENDPCGIYKLTKSSDYVEEQIAKKFLNVSRPIDSSGKMSWKDVHRAAQKAERIIALRPSTVVNDQHRSCTTTMVRDWQLSFSKMYIILSDRNCLANID
jgi:hypothetical protein